MDKSHKVSGADGWVWSYSCLILNVRGLKSGVISTPGILDWWCNSGGVVFYLFHFTKPRSFVTGPFIDFRMSQWLLVTSRIPV